MKIDPNPLFRKAIAPWYDNNAACWILLVALIGVAVFSGAGIAVASSRRTIFTISGCRSHSSS